MREIKFRGKKFGTNKWCYGTPLIHDENTVFMADVVTKGACHTSLIIPETVGQFTGLTDKNGKEIYEGDMLKDVYEGWKAIVEFNEGCFEPFGRPDYSNPKSYEVVGNIHEKGETK